MANLLLQVETKLPKDVCDHIAASVWWKEEPLDDRSETNIVPVDRHQHLIGPPLGCLACIQLDLAKISLVLGQPRHCRERCLVVLMYGTFVAHQQRESMLLRQRQPLLVILWLRTARCGIGIP